MTPTLLDTRILATAFSLNVGDGSGAAADAAAFAVAGVDGVGRFGLIDGLLGGVMMEGETHGIVARRDVPVHCAHVHFHVHVCVHGHIHKPVLHVHIHVMAHRHADVPVLHVWRDTARGRERVAHEGEEEEREKGEEFFFWL